MDESTSVVKFEGSYLRMIVVSRSSGVNPMRRIAIISRGQYTLQQLFNVNAADNMNKATQILIMDRLYLLTNMKRKALLNAVA